MPRLVYTFQGAGAGSVKSQIQDIDRSASRAAADEDKRAKKLRRGRARARLKRIREAKRAAAQEQKIAEASAKKTARTESRAADKAERDTDRRAKRMRRNRAKARLRRIKDKQKEIRQLESLAKKEARVTERAATRKRAGRRQLAGQVGGAALGIAGVAATAIIGGTIGLSTAAARQQIGLEDKARTLAIQGRDAGGKAQSAQDITKRAQAVARKVGGTTAESVIDAMTTFVTRTGKFEVAESMAETFATVAKATGASADDIAGAGADLFEKFDITSIDDMREALTALTFQGKKGAFELADAASQFPKLAAAAQRLGIGKGVGAVKTLGGLTQIARTSTGSAEAAATSLEAVFTGLTTKQGALKKHGVQVFDKEGKAKDIRQLLTDVVSKVGGGDVAEKKGELAKIFGRQGIRGLSPLIAAYANATKEGMTAQEKAAAGADAVATALNNAIDAPGTWSDVLDDAAIANESISSKLTDAWEQIVAASGDTLVPAIQQFANGLDDLLGSFGGMEAISFMFDVVAENIGAFGDALQAVGQFLIDKGLIDGPSTSQRIETEKKKQATIDRAIERKDVIQQRLGKRIGEGRGTKADEARFIELSDEIGALIEKRKASEQVQKGIEAEAKVTDGVVRDAFAKGSGTANKPFFNEEQFREAFVTASRLTPEQEAAFEPDIEGGQIQGPVTLREQTTNQADALIASISRGEQVNTANFSPEVGALLSEVMAQVGDFSRGNIEGAPSDAIGLTGDQVTQINQLGSAASSAAGKLNAIPAPGAGDIDS